MADSPELAKFKTLFLEYAKAMLEVTNAKFVENGAAKVLMQEYEWFEHMHRRTLAIHRVLPEDAFRPPLRMYVEQVRFSAKQTTELRDGSPPRVEHSFEATLEATESLWGAVRRLSYGIVQDDVLQFFIATLSGLSIAVAVRYLPRGAP